MCQNASLLVFQEFHFHFIHFHLSDLRSSEVSQEREVRELHVAQFSTGLRMNNIYFNLKSIFTAQNRILAAETRHYIY